METERAMRNPRLYGIGTDNRYEVTVVRPPAFTVGRAPDCSLVISNFAVSRHHCIFEFDETTWTLTDLSLGGTYINGKKVPKGIAIPLDEGSVVKLGPHTFFIYIFSFRDRDDLEPVLSRLALRMQGGDECKMLGTVSTSWESSVPMDRLWNERLYHTPQSVPHVNNGVNETFQDTRVHSSNAICSSSPSGMATTARAHARFYDPGTNKRIHELSVICNPSCEHGIQPSGFYGPSSSSGECSSKKMRHRSQDSVDSNITNGMNRVNEMSGSFYSQSSALPGLQASQEAFIANPMYHRFISSWRPSGHASGSSYSNEQLNQEIIADFHAINATHFKKQELDFRRKVLEYQANVSRSMAVNQERQAPLEETRVPYERKLTKVCKPQHKIGLPSSQQALSVGPDHWESDDRQNCNEQSETPGLTASKHAANLTTYLKCGQQPRNDIPKPDVIKEALDKIQLEFLNEVTRESKKLENSLAMQMRNSDETLKELRKKLAEANEANDSLSSGIKKYEEKLKNVYSAVENDLQCSICNEIFVTPITLNCRHTFCEYCIVEWKKKKRDCPMCRTPIVTESRSLPFENFIDKITETNEGIKEHRLEVIKQRIISSPGRNVERDEESEIQEIPNTDESSNVDESPPVINIPTEEVPLPDIPGAEMVFNSIPSGEMVLNYIPNGEMVHIDIPWFSNFHEV